MVLEFYNLQEQPFGSTPDPRYLFASETHREALASLLYGIKTRRGFVALIARPGMGKTTLLFRSLNKLKGEAKTVFLFQSISSPLEFLRTLLADLGVNDAKGGLDELQATLTQILTEHSQRGEQLIVVVDEAQNLDNTVLELVRMLSNFETSKEKLMQIVLAGQPQLATKLASPELLQLRQRISIVANLQPFNEEETAKYVQHRLQVAGYNGREPLFSAGAMKLIAEYSQGIPRNINTLCFNAMSIGAVLKMRVIQAEVVREVIGDLDLNPLGDVFNASRPRSTRALEQPTRSKSRVWAISMAVILLAAAAFAANAFVRGRTHATAAPQAQRAAAVLDVEPNIIPVADVALSNDLTFVAIPLRSTPLPSKRQVYTAASRPDHVQHIWGSGVNSNEVLVKPGMNFYSICGEVFSTCTTARVKELHHLNPWLDDSNRVRVGDVLVVPPRTDLSEANAPRITNP